MLIIDSQVRMFEASTPKRPWHIVPNRPTHVTGNEMAAAMGGLARAWLNEAIIR